MPSGIPLSPEERYARHKQIYGSGSEPPAVRIGRPGGRAGVPRTDEERMAIHALYYSTPLPTTRQGLAQGGMLATRGDVALMTKEDARRLHEQRYGVPPGMMIKCVGTECRLVPVPMAEEKLAIPLLAVAAWIVANKLILVTLTILAAALYVGLSVAYAVWEKAKRYGLPPFQMVVAAPKPEDIDDPQATYAFGIIGAVPGRRVSVKFGKGTYIGYADPVFRECIANARGECLIQATGREVAEAAENRKFIVGSLPMMGESGDVTVSMYAQEDRRMLQRDIRSPIQPVRIHIPTMTENIAKGIPCLVPPHGISSKDADEGFAAGGAYYIKFAIPFMCCFPGLPYTPGMWVPPGFIISRDP